MAETVMSGSPPRETSDHDGASSRPGPPGSGEWRLRTGASDTDPHWTCSKKPPGDSEPGTGG